MNIQDLLRKLASEGIQLVADGDKLRCSPGSAVTPEIGELIRQHKAPLLELAQDWNSAIATKWEDCDGADEGEPEQNIPPSPACSCGSLLCWWDGADRRRCLKCDPPLKSLRLLGSASSLGRVVWGSWPAGDSPRDTPEKTLTIPEALKRRGVTRELLRQRWSASELPPAFYVPPCHEPRG